MELTGEEMEPSTSDSSHHDNTTVRDACAGVARFLSKQRSAQIVSTSQSTSVFVATTTAT